jgi:hypothetical protein
MPGETGVTVVTTAGEHFYPFLPTRLRAHRAPGIPCALSFEGQRFWQTSRENTRRDREAVSTSFRDGPKDQTRNLEIPGSMLRIAPE